MRVAFLAMDVGVDGRPGPTDIVWEMTRESASLGLDTWVIAPEGATSPLEGVQIAPFRVPPTAYRWFLGQLWLALRMVRVARSVNPDIIHTPEYLTSAVFTVANRRTPVVLTVPGNIFQRLSVPGGNQASFLYTETIKWAARTSARRCATVIAFTREMKGWWERTGSSPDRTPVIPYGVDTLHFTLVPDARERLGLEEAKLVFLYVGRLDREKGLFDALNAFRIAHTRIGLRDVRFDIVGSGRLRTELEAQSVALGISDYVHFHGPADRSCLPLWYSAADALILPSWIEPFGRVMLEAMACGTPVLATTTGGPIDHIVPGENGFLFSSRDPEALAGLIVQAIDNPAELSGMRSKALEHVEKSLSWTSIMRRIVDEVYVPVLARRSPGPSSTVLPATERQIVEAECSSAESRFPAGGATTFHPKAVEDHR